MLSYLAMRDITTNFFLSKKYCHKRSPFRMNFIRRLRRLSNAVPHECRKKEKKIHASNQKNLEILCRRVPFRLSEAHDHVQLKLHSKPRSHHSGARKQSRQYHIDWDGQTSAHIAVPYLEVLDLCRLPQLTFRLYDV